MFGHSLHLLRRPRWRLMGTGINGGAAGDGGSDKPPQSRTFEKRSEGREAVTPAPSHTRSPAGPPPVQLPPPRSSS